MSSVYVAGLVVGGGLAVFSAFGELTARRGAEADPTGPVYALRSLVYSLAAFGATGLLLGRFDPGLGTGLTLLFAVLGGWLGGGLAGTLLTFLARPTAGPLDQTPEGNRP